MLDRVEEDVEVGSFGLSRQTVTPNSSTPRIDVMASENTEIQNANPGEFLNNPSNRPKMKTV